MRSKTGMANRQGDAKLALWLGVAWPQSFFMTTPLWRWNRQSFPKRWHIIQTPWNYPDESIQVIFLPAGEMSIVALEMGQRPVSRLRLKRDGTRAENRFRLSPKRTSPFKS